MRANIKLLIPVFDKTSADLAKTYACHAVYINYDHAIHHAAELYPLLQTLVLPNIPIFINIQDNTLKTTDIKSLLNLATELGIAGYIVNDLHTLELLTQKHPSKHFIAGPGLNIHNIETAKFFSQWNLNTLIITEEVNLKNILAIQKALGKDVGVVPNNLIWILEEAISSGIDQFLMFDDIQDSHHLVTAVKILSNLNHNKISSEDIEQLNTVLKKAKDGFYTTNHFTETLITPEQTITKLTKQIRKYHSPDLEEYNLDSSLVPHTTSSHPNVSKIKLRINRIEHLEFLKDNYKSLFTEIIDSVEYSELIPPYDLAEKSFKEIVKYADQICSSLNLPLTIATPAVLIERDFNRVYIQTKEALSTTQVVNTLMINNLGFYWRACQDQDLQDINLLLGKELKIFNSHDYNKLAEYRKNLLVDLSHIEDYTLLYKILRDLSPVYTIKNYTVSSLKKALASGLCPLNNYLPYVSRITCPAPCHNGDYAIENPTTQETLPMVLDGFCRMHLFEDQMIHKFHDIESLKQEGINSFSIDLTGITPEALPVLIDTYKRSSSKELCYER